MFGTSLKSSFLLAMLVIVAPTIVHHLVRPCCCNPSLPPLPQIKNGVGTSIVKISLRLSGTPGWAKAELLDAVQSLSQLLPSTGQSSELIIDLQISQPSVYRLSRSATRADGDALSTTDLLAYTMVPVSGAIRLTTRAVGCRVFRYQLLLAALSPSGGSDGCRELNGKTWAERC